MDRLWEMFVGVGAAKVRDMFEQGRKNTLPYFIDEIDEVGRQRKRASAAEMTPGNKSFLLVEMDGLMAMRALLSSRPTA